MTNYILTASFRQQILSAEMLMASPPTSVVPGSDLSGPKKFPSIRKDKKMMWEQNSNKDAEFNLYLGRKMWKPNSNTDAEFTWKPNSSSSFVSIVMSSSKLKGEIQFDTKFDF